MIHRGSLQVFGWEEETWKPVGRRSKIHQNERPKVQHMYANTTKTPRFGDRDIVDAVHKTGMIVSSDTWWWYLMDKEVSNT